VLQPEGQEYFLDLAFERAVGREEQVLGELLGDGRTALDRLAGQVVDEGARQAQRIDAEMGIEAPVLDGDDRLRQVGRHFLERQGFAAGRAAIGDDRAVDGGDLHVRRTVGNGPGAGGRHSGAVIKHKPSDADAGPDAEHETPVDQSAQRREKAAALATRWSFFVAGGAVAFRALVAILAFGSRWAPAGPAVAHDPFVSVETEIVARPRTFEGWLNAFV